MISLRGLDRGVRPYAEYALALGRYFGLDPRVTSTRRSWAQQERLYSDYKAGKSRYPAAIPGLSAHQYGLAFDSVVPPDQQAAWDAVRTYVGWQVPSNDRIHAQVPNWKSYVNIR